MKVVLLLLGYKLDSQPGFCYSRGYGYNSRRSPFGYNLRGFGPEPPKTGCSYCPANFKAT